MGLLHHIPRSKYRYLLLLNGWFFQGYGNTARAERAYKICFEIVIFIPIFVLTISILNLLIISIAISFIISHTISWLINCGIWCMFRGKYGFKIWRVKLDNPTAYWERIRAESQKNKAVEKVLLLGSYAKTTAKQESDIDLKIIIRPNFINGIRVISFIIKERLYALVHFIPLDMSILDDINQLKIKFDEIPVIIYER